MKKYLEEQIERQLNTYRKEPDRMVADYNHEKELVGEYNGRQLLELIQNADDEGSEIIEIEVDEKNEVLIISNNGESFSQEGFKSLMIPNLSSKTKDHFIGNKGLGFRAIINWAERIIIESANVKVEFSKQVITSVFNKLYDNATQNKILIDRGLSKNAVPLAFLSVPNVTDSSGGDWVTRIYINFKKEYLEDINHQISTLQKEILLFLNNINTISVKLNNETYSIERSVTENIINIDDIEWHVYQRKKKLLPHHLQDDDKNEKEYFSLKIAITDDLKEKSNKLFNFFPTKVDINFPMIIHGTFDLDSSRNQLINSEKNKYILNCLIDLIIETAKTISGEEVSWKPLKLLDYKKKNEVLSELGFYEKIDDAISGLSIFPCIDNKYRKRDEVVFLDEDLTRLIIETENIDLFENIVKPTQLIENVQDKYGLSDYIEDYEDKFDQLSNRLLSQNIDYRVDLIYLLYKIYKYEDCELQLLINDDNQIITKENEVYTPITTSSIDKLTYPEFVYIEFINKELYGKLLIKFDIKSNEKARDLQRLIKSITNIQSYEPAQVLRKIITSTNNIIKTNEDNADEYISKMVVSLYLNYISIENIPRIPPDTKVQLLSLEGSIEDANDLFLSAAYPSGIKTETLFKKILTSAEFLAEPSKFDEILNSENINTVERFFLWLGVNRFTKFVRKSRDYNYENFVFSKIGWPDEYRDCSYNMLAIEKEQFEQIMDNLSLEEIIFWVISDTTIKKYLELEHDDTFKYSVKFETVGTHSHNLYDFPSYIYYQLINAKLFIDYLVLDDKHIEFINDIKFSYDHKLFVDNNISKREIDDYIIRLGAKEKFDELSFERVLNIIEELETKDKLGNQTQKLYKLALEHYKKNKQPIKSELKLFAKKGSEQGYYSNSEVYFSENIRLPKVISDDIAILNFPRRAGGKQAIEFFGINNLNAIDIKVNSYIGINKLTEEFNSLLNTIKPYLLAYRIENLQKEKHREAVKLNNLTIELCSEVNCVFNNEKFALEINDYVFSDKKYLIRINENRTISELRKDLSFCDTFSEILTSVFSVVDHQIDFRKVFIDDFNETEHVIKNYFGLELLNESRNLLGISNPFASFWAAIFSSLEYKIDIELAEKNIKAICEKLNIDDSDISNINYDHLNDDEDNIERLGTIFNKLNIKIVEFNEHAFYKVDLTNYHSDNLHNLFHSKLKIIKNGIWLKLSKSDFTDKRKLLDLISLYEKNEDWIQEVSSSQKYCFKQDYLLVWNQYFSKVLGDLDYETSDVNFDKYFEENVKSLKQEQLEILSNSQRSLLYFNDGLEIVLKELEELIKNESDHQKETVIPIKTIPKGTLQTEATPSSNNKKKNKKSGKYNPNREKGKRASGKRAEDIVFASLVKEYSKEYVEHVSIRDDSLGYDIKYSYDKGKSWRYVEVKRYVQNNFHISINEYNFYKKHKSNYEIFLVDADDEILAPLKNIEFDDDNKFNMQPTEYTVSFVIKGDSISLELE